MTKKDFIKKYPELLDGEEVSHLKISLLKRYSRTSISDSDFLIKDILKDYDNMTRCEKRHNTIDTILNSKERL